MSDKLEIPKEAFELLKTDEVKQLVEHSEKKLENMTEETTTLSSRSINLIFAMLTIMTALITVSFDTAKDGVDRFAAATCSLVILAVCWFLKKNITPTEFRTTGDSPQNLVQMAFFENLQGKDAMFYVWMKQLHEVHRKINQAAVVNKERAESIRDSIMLLASCPIFVAIIYSVNSIFLQ